MKCPVCKQEIHESDLTVDTPQGKVHAGVCEKYLNEMGQTLNESEVDTKLDDIQLL